MLRNYGDDTVSVINTGTNTVTATLHAGGGPIGVAVNPKGTAVYVANQLGKTLYVFDPLTNTRTSIISFGSGAAGPGRVAVNPTGTIIYMTDTGIGEFFGNSVWVISATGAFVAHQVTVGNGPDGVAVNPKGTAVYVANTLDGTVSVIDPTTNTVTATIPIGFGTEPTAVAVDPKGSTVYVTDTGTGQISLIDTATNTVTGTVSVGSGPDGVAVASSNPLGFPRPSSVIGVYVTNFNSNSVSVLNYPTNSAIDTVPVGNTPEAVASNPTGSYVYVANTGDNTISVIDTASNAVIDTVPVGNSPIGIAVAPLKALSNKL